LFPNFKKLTIAYGEAQDFKAPVPCYEERIRYARPHGICLYRLLRSAATFSRGDKQAQEWKIFAAIIAAYLLLSVRDFERARMYK
jgi:hypothetical protein